MHSFTGIFTTSLTFLLAVASAMPANNVARQHFTDCEAGTAYFKCGEHNGCFAADPCSATPVGASTPDTTTGQCPTGSDAAELVPSALYDIFPKHPDLVKGTVSGVHVEAYDDASQVEQVLVFTGIPAEAKECRFGWKQGERIERVFVIDGANALSQVRQLSGFPEGNQDVSFNSIRPFADAGKDIGSVDFTNWQTSGATTHDGGSVNCAEAMYFKVSLKDPKSNTQLYLTQNQDNGFYVSYTC